MVALCPCYEGSFGSFIQVKPGVSRLDHEKGTAWFSLAKNKVACGEVCLLESLLLLHVHLHDVWLEENIPGPVYDHVELATDGGDLHQIDGPPEEPGQKTGESQSIDFRYAVVMADGGQKSLWAKIERLCCLSALDPNQI